MALRKIGIILLLLTGLTVQAQYFGGPFSPYTGNPGLLGTENSQSPYRFNLQTGAIYSTGYGSGSLFNSFIAPSFSKNIGKKLTVSAGTIISNTTYSNLNLINHEGSFKPYSGNLTSALVYVSGAYQVNEKLTVSGSAFKTINPAFNSRLNPNQLRMDAQGMSFGIGYKVSDNVHIGAEIRYQQGNSGLNSPYGIQGNSPFLNQGTFGY